MNIDLLGYRQNAGMEQLEVANALDISKVQVNLYEQAPDTVPMGLLVKWLQILGIDLATAMSAPVPLLKGIDPGTPYTELYEIIKILEAGKNFFGGISWSNTKINLKDIIDSKKS